MPDDPVTDFLADVRMQAEGHHLVPGADALRLLAALEAALKLHRPDGRNLQYVPCAAHAESRGESRPNTGAGWMTLGSLMVTLLGRALCGHLNIGNYR